MKTSHKHTHTRTKTQSSTVTTLNKLRVHHRMSKYSPMCRNRAWLTSQKMVLSYKKTASVCTFSMQHSDAFTNHSQLQTFSKAHKQHDRVLFKKKRRSNPLFQSATIFIAVSCESTCKERCKINFTAESFKIAIVEQWYFSHIELPSVQLLQKFLVNVANYNMHFIALIAVTRCCTAS